MKKLLTTLWIILLIIESLYAQVSKTVNVINAGSLSTLLTTTEKTTVTNLSITGTVDARDFVTLREAMTVLAVLNMSTVSIVTYTGTAGTGGTTSQTYPAKELPAYSFYNLKGLIGNFTLPNSITNIGSSAFCGCSGLTTITIPNTVSSIGLNAFVGCSGLTSILIPNSVTTIGGSSFSGCNSLTTITIPNSVTSIESSAFNNCSGLKTIIIPSSVSSIANQTFCGCSGLTTITIPNSVTSIGSSAFYYCSGLKSIIIPSSVSSIEDQTFCGCSALTTITIPNNVSAIGKSAFLGCTKLASIFVNISTPINLIISTYVFGSVNKSSCKLYVPSASVSLYKSSNQWMDFANIAALSTTPILETNAITNITKTTAISGGEIGYMGTSSVTMRGICWGTSVNPTILNSKTTDGTDIGTFTSSITGLIASTFYHARAYATNSNGTSYGTDYTFTTTSAVYPSLSTSDVSSITTTTATTGGVISESGDGGSRIITRGVCWGTNLNPSIGNNSTTNDGFGLGTFMSSITGLTPATTYHVRAYATSNGYYTNYGFDFSFTTLSFNTGVEETLIENLIVYPNPTIGKITLDIGSDFENNFTVSLTNLLGQKVYVAKFATNKLTIDLRRYNFKGIFLLQLQNEKGSLLSEKKIIFK